MLKRLLFARPNSFVRHASCSGFVLIVMMALAVNPTLGQSEIVVIDNTKTNYNVIVGKFVRGETDLQDQLLVVAGTSTTYRADVNVDVEIYPEGNLDAKARLGSVRVERGGHTAELANPGLKFQIEKMRCTEINYSEPGWEVELNFVVEIEVLVDNNIHTSNKIVFGDPDSNAKNPDKTMSRISVEYDDPDVDGERATKDLFGEDGHVIPITLEDLEKCNVRVKWPFAEEVDDTSADDPISVTYSNGKNEKIFESVAQRRQEGVVTFNEDSTDMSITVDFWIDTIPMCQIKNNN